MIDAVPPLSPLIIRKTVRGGLFCVSVFVSASTGRTHCSCSCHSSSGGALRTTARTSIQGSRANGSGAGGSDGGSSGGSTSSSDSMAILVMLSDATFLQYARISDT